MFTTNVLGAYFEQEVLSADPLDLVCMLYQAAIGRVRDARRHLEARAVAPRCEAISKACDIVGELMSSLDLEKGGEVAFRLRDLYVYILSRLLEANLQKKDEPLAEAIGLLTTLGEGWRELANASRTEAPPVQSYFVPAPLMEHEAVMA